MSNHCSLLIPPTDSGISYATKLLQDGDIVAFPTETVYGLGANALNEDAVRSIFTAKGRPLTDPLIVHVSEKGDAYRLVNMTPEEQFIFDTLADAFWPGPLTIIVKASTLIPPLVTAQTGFVGIRCPRHQLAQRLLKVCSLPIAAPSANRFGHVSPTKAEHVLADLACKGVHVLNGEDSSHLSADQQHCEFGIESTVLKVDNSKRQIAIFRQGAITEMELKDALRDCECADWSVSSMIRAVKMHSTSDRLSSSVEKPVCESSSGEQAPGQAITHYAPDVSCTIIREILTTSNENGLLPTLHLSREEISSCVVIDFGRKGSLQSLQHIALAYKNLSITGSSTEAARVLFAALRWSEEVRGAQRVLISDVSNDIPGIDSSILMEGGCNRILDIHDMMPGLADRLFRAASGSIMNLLIS